MLYGDSDVRAMLGFIRAVRAHIRAVSDAPILVHCRYFHDIQVVPFLSGAHRSYLAYLAAICKKILFRNDLPARARVSAACSLRSTS